MHGCQCGNTDVFKIHGFHPAAAICFYLLRFPRGSAILFSIPIYPSPYPARLRTHAVRRKKKMMCRYLLQNSHFRLKCILKIYTIYTRCTCLIPFSTIPYSTTYEILPQPVWKHQTDFYSVDLGYFPASLSTVFPHNSHSECGLPVWLPFRRIPRAALATLLVTADGSAPIALFTVSGTPAHIKAIHEAACLSPLTLCF